MPKTKTTQSSLAGLIDSDSDDGQFGGEHSQLTPESSTIAMAPAKRGPGRPKATTAKKTITGRVTKTRVPVRRTSGRVKLVKASAKAPAKSAKRKALADKTNQQDAEDTEDVDEFDQVDDVTMEEADELDNSTVAAKEKKSKSTKKKPTTSRAKTTQKVDETPGAQVVEPRAAKKSRKVKADAIVELEKEISETQVETEMDVDDEIDDDEEVDEDISEDIEPIDVPFTRQKQSAVQPRQASRKGGTASDTERNDPALRRKLGELTRKCEKLELRYRDLKEIGIKDAEREFDKLKKQMDEREKITKGLINSLKSDIATEKAAAKEAQTLRKKLEAQNTEIANLQAKLTQVTTTLTEAQSQNKALSTKLATSRTAAASVESVSTKVPGSAVKANGGIRMIGSAEAAQAAQAAQLKEDLYSDLSGLIVRSVKRDAEEDVFDCIQTGRNGTLHFKLGITNEKSADSYEEAQCVYSPLLDPSRDKAMMDLLPDYLTDEITFPRPQAAKFYARVVKALTEN
ncbi:hypothetical protein BP6252_04311 [Coleophoma cylindrospora]|uniref:Monopolin complex subunit Csm1/Pcs1 C-terminal domain-containing protein n=1 Tax=Coleophoma cylindrospora TaxID=1849047 RepID=A0A3D8S044_9HELO|nr:hypothetical protein BP6252_04311 [Coleophoma cylindrospora]